MGSLMHDNARIYYEEHGDGFPLLSLAPGGLMSRIDRWSLPTVPLDPTKVFSADYRVVTMDQRNAGGNSDAPITSADGWHTYTADQIAVLDHLGIERCHIYGQCGGGPFILSLLKSHPHRFASAIIARPFGSIGPATPARSEHISAWIRSLSDRADATEAVLDSVCANLFGSGWAYSVDRDAVSKVPTPCLVLAGNDEDHPFMFAQELADLLPQSEFISEWMAGEHLTSAIQHMRLFLAQHTPS